MHVSLDLPSRAFAQLPDWLGGYTFSDLADALEASGLDGVSLSDHPAPPDRWLAVGGHQSLDPFVLLAALAARTTRVRLISNLIVAGYRSPLITAKAATSLDVVSSGRLVLGMGAGYVEEEFAALGADFAGRGPAFDAAIRLIRGSWAGESLTVEQGSDACAHTVLPRPVQAGGPPIWIGGNSSAARRRAALLADGWLPFMQEEAQAQITGTDALTSTEQLAGQIHEMRQLAIQAGRPGTLTVCLAPGRIGSPERLEQYLANNLEACLEAGVTWLTWQSTAKSLEALIGDLGTVKDILDRNVNSA
jgi:probable F420-dependent oxidoreductase